MSDKIPQMTEEQYINFIKNMFGYTPTDQEIREAIRKGYIIKPEIEQKIDEVEKLYQRFDFEYNDLNVETSWNNTIETLQSCYNLIQLLKPYYFNSKEK